MRRPMVATSWKIEMQMAPGQLLEQDADSDNDSGCEALHARQPAPALWKASAAQYVWMVPFNEAGLFEQPWAE